MISYGGIRLISVPPDGLFMPPSEVFGFFRPKTYGDKNFNPRAHFAWFLNRGVRLNTFYNPWSASRWGTAFVLTHQAGLDAIREQVYGEAEDEYNALPFVIEDKAGTIVDGHTSRTLTTNLYMLPAIPLAKPPNSETDPGQQLYLLILVDVRYFWWEKAAEISVTEGTTTWTQLYTSLAAALGVSITVSSINAAYLKPSNGFTKDYQHLPLLLDLAASSVGQRIVRKLDGTFHALSPEAGGAIVEGQVDSFVVLAGDWLEDEIADVPGTVSVAFPRADFYSVNTSLRMNSDVRVESRYLKAITGDAGHEGVQLIHSAAIANFLGGGTPANTTQLDSLAQKIADDWYAWRSGAFVVSMSVRSPIVEILYRTVAPWTADGFHDVEWSHHGTISTRVHRSEWEPEHGKLKHSGEFGSSDEPPICGTQGVKVVTGTLLTGNVFDALLLLRDNDARTDGNDEAIWVYDWNDSGSLSANAKYNGTFRGIEPAGPIYVARASSTGAALSDTTKWLPLVGSITPSAWSAVTAYVVGNLVTSGGNTYLCILNHTNQVPPNATYWVQVTLVDEEGYRAAVAYTAGDYVQEVRGVYSIRHVRGVDPLAAPDVDQGEVSNVTQRFGGEKVFEGVIRSESDLADDDNADVPLDVGTYTNDIKSQSEFGDAACVMSLRTFTDGTDLTSFIAMLAGTDAESAHETDIDWSGIPEWHRIVISQGPSGGVITFDKGSFAGGGGEPDTVMVGSETTQSTTQAGLVFTKGWLTGGAFNPWVAAPATASDTGTAGQMAYDGSFIYVCTATNTWKRAGIATW